MTIRNNIHLWLHFQIQLALIPVTTNVCSLEWGADVEESDTWSLQRHFLHYTVFEFAYRKGFPYITIQRLAERHM